jgi:TolB-like protein
MTEPARQQGFFAELNRRNVFRVGMAYVLVGWILLQIADVLFPALTLPEWTTRLVAGLLLLGFPLALFFAWAFELTPDGLKREADVPREESITHKTRRKLDFVVVGVLLVALTLMLVDKFVWQASESAPESFVAATSEDKSIAVLPFANMSDDPANEYFSDGITEELLNLLAKVPELRVIGRTSSFQFKNKNEDLRIIGEKLGVTNILEGSVRKSGNTVRVTAQLINSSDGAHLWTET